jgi:hypothetical protein
MKKPIIPKIDPDDLRKAMAKMPPDVKEAIRPLFEDERLREWQEVQRAHDLLIPIVTGEVPHPCPEQAVEIHLALDVLCWVLRHEHNTKFASNLAHLEDWLARQGVIVIRGDPKRAAEN